jgi:hypothetical protein
LAPTVTEGSAGAVIVNGTGATTIDADADSDCSGLLLSLTVTVKVEVPLIVGEPEIIPVEDVSLSPAGSWPELIDQV